MVKPKEASRSSASCSANDAPQRHGHAGGLVCGWRRRLKVTAPNFTFTLKCKRNHSSLTETESRSWHRLVFVASPSSDESFAVQLSLSDLYNSRSGIFFHLNF